MQELTVFHYENIDSTQKEIWRQISNNKIKNGTVISAKVQNSGVGTHGRTWYSTDNNIAFSFYYELNCGIKNIDGITIDIAKLISRIFSENYNFSIDIKQPNDLYVNGKKLGGILTETKVSGDVVKFIVVGIGINNSQVSFTDKLKDVATSIKKEFEQEIDVDEFIKCFCSEFEEILIKRIEGNI